MDRKHFNECISAGLKGKKFTKEERRLEFCVLAKLCSQKSKNREEAKHICSQPKKPKPVKTGKSLIPLAYGV